MIDGACNHDDTSDHDTSERLWDLKNFQCVCISIKQNKSNVKHHFDRRPKDSLLHFCEFFGERRRYPELRSRLIMPTVAIRSVIVTI
jgi:hypothetical protein